MRSYGKAIVRKHVPTSPTSSPPLKKAKKMGIVQEKKRNWNLRTMLLRGK
jgi:hypothetical protein